MDMLKLVRSLLRSISDEPKQKSRSSGAKQRTSSSSSAPKKNTPRTKSNVSHSTKTYGEESIFTAPRNIFQNIPQQIRQMRTLSGYQALTGQRSMESLFYQQGKFMEQFTDDYPETVLCGRSTPMYYNLKDNELRAYFTWRTRYRQGMLPPAQNAFLLLYAYECINLIGFSEPTAAGQALSTLLQDYGSEFPAVRKQLLRWIPDFAAYYGLPCPCDDPKEAAAITVLRHSAHSAEELLDALNLLSKYRIKDSKFYLANPELTAAVVERVYQALLYYYAEKKNASYSAALLGGQRRQEHLLFEGAVFCQQRQMSDQTIRLSPLCVYQCFGGKWAKTVFASDPDGAKIGAMLRTVDSLLRERTKFKGKLKQGELPEGDLKVIQLAIEDYYREEAKKNAPVIELDSAELARIRAAAEHTTDMLTLPEDLPEEAPLPAVPEEIEEPEEPADPDDLPALPLSAPALALLICLLTGESYQPLVDAGHMLSVLADEINENLYDEIGDTVIETGEDGAPVLVEDYAETLRGMVET